MCVEKPAPKRFLVPLLCCVLSFGVVWAQDDPAVERVRECVEQLRQGEGLWIEDVAIGAVHLIPAFYEQRDFRLAWTRPQQVDDAIGLIERSHEEGLLPQDYNLTALKRARDASRRAPEDGTLRANLDILTTESLVRLAYHYHFGKVSPEELDADWNLSRDLGGIDPVERFEAMAGAPSPIPFAREVLPQIEYYANVRAALARYREIEDGGGWPTLSKGDVLKPGMESDRVARLRQRLVRSSDLPSAGTMDPRRFDEDLKQAVIRFQDRHGLDADGVVGGQTLNALNVPVERRIDQLRLSLERARWVFRDLADEYVVTSIAEFRVFLVNEHKVVWSARAQVGKPYRKTPVFKAALEYVVFNPTWTVPPTILRKDVLPKVKSDPDYLRQKNMSIVERSGRVVDPATLDWSSISAGRFPYSIRQEPGPNNALGRVKFIFPNKHFVFLHDTPSRSLFDRSGRAFSSGCIRVEQPLELAELLLDDPAAWNQETIAVVLEAGKTKTVFLDQPLQVLLLYWTAAVYEDGVVRFMRDVYDRDPRILKALNGEFVFRAPTGIPGWGSE